jgi:integrase
MDLSGLRATVSQATAFDPASEAAVERQWPVVRSYEGEFLSARSAQRSHVGLDPGLVDEDEALRIKTGYQRSISGSMPILLTTKTGRSFKKRYFAEQWEETCKKAEIADLHFHDIRGTTVTMLFQAGCNLGEIVSITGHSLRRAQEILDKYLARTSTMADNAIAKFENVLETDFAKRAAKREV